MKTGIQQAAPLTPEASLLVDRRAVLKLGLSGTVVLGVAGVGAALTGCGRREEAAAQGYRFLRDADVRLFQALMPVVLEGASLSAEIVAASLLQLDALLAHTEANSRVKLRKLFDLLHFTPTRWLTTGIRAPWERASREEIRDFLQRWHGSTRGQFNIGYRVLARLTGMGYFASPAGHAVAGYPGPLARVYRAVNS